ncbi:MAG: hypothetical protein EBU21_17100 [Proteobacteria bacterium]|nr:hypothetical protein [Pseudomonadota bacterium]
MFHGSDRAVVAMWSPKARPLVFVFRAVQITTRSRYGRDYGAIRSSPDRASGSPPHRRFIAS